MDKFLIVDGNNIAFRAFYALPPLTDEAGNPTSAIFGFLNILIKVIKEYSPSMIAVAFDKGKSTFRHKQYKNYKAMRRPTPPELVQQMPVLKQLLKDMNITVLEEEEIEADDIIGILTKKFDTQNYVLSADKDVFQLIGNNTSVIVPQKGVAQSLLLTEEKLLEMHEISPSQVIELKSLMGDSSDNIPGVKGVGEKTALALLKEYGTLDGVYQNIENITGKLKEKLEQDKENAYLSRSLATINTQFPIACKRDDFSFKFPFSIDIYREFQKKQFKSLLSKDLFDESTETVINAEQEGLLSDEADAEKAKEAVIRVESEEQFFSMIANIETTTKKQKDSEMVFHLDKNMHILFADTEWEIVIRDSLFFEGIDYVFVINNLKQFFENENISKIVFNSKHLKTLLLKDGIEFKNVVFDLVIARYMLKAGSKTEVGLMDVATENNVKNLTVCRTICSLMDIFIAEIKNLDVERVYYDIELPLVDVLIDMEETGFKIDNEELSLLQQRYESDIAEIEKQVIELAGVEFNLNSPKQVGEVLFERLQLSRRNNKKLSTNVDVLTDLYYQHEIVPLILKHRKYTKLYNTYIKSFGEIQDKATHKIHTVFNQTLTATGRLSSSEPNLQNIPIRTEEGRELRKIFVSSFEDGVIVSADYNQVELRLLASFSQDKKLIDAYRAGEDIHSRTASEIFGVDYNAVSPDLRRKAKAINFGIIYGISDYGLSQNIGSTRAVAANYISLYFEKYPRIEQYMKENVEFCKTHGYAKTLFGRIRKVPEINSSNYVQRSFGERVAMNMPLQGSASDIIKFAMIRVEKLLKKMKLKSKLILQVHDELIIDTDREEKDIVVELLKREMESVVSLDVNLDVSVSFGKNWLEAH